MTNDNIAQLRSLYDSNSAYQAIFDYLAGRTQNRSVMKVDRVVQQLQGEATRKDVIDLSKKLEEMNLGAFIVGRRGKPSRFEWASELTQVGRVAAGEEAELRPYSADEEDSEDPEDMVTHEYMLRPDLPIEIRLPADLTEREAQRLGEYVRTLSF
ncbi:hypothetical protein [Thioalkalivibrio thiocyanoxidans]|uniref:hypothetical protein n=1 Tax=Thioalkalivibrio thiocyanoxidans TaxID=152475 RepID=UPI0003625CEF|nr:hypothetical protein [Thioalkalivibrio thiocyanoxidans]